jgi:hypothetical protein
MVHYTFLNNKFQLVCFVLITLIVQKFTIDIASCTIIDIKLVWIKLYHKMDSVSETKLWLGLLFWKIMIYKKFYPNKRINKIIVLDIRFFTRQVSDVGILIPFKIIRFASANILWPIIFSCSINTSYYEANESLSERGEKIFFMIKLVSMANVIVTYCLLRRSLCVFYLQMNICLLKNCHHYIHTTLPKEKERERERERENLFFIRHIGKKIVLARFFSFLSTVNRCITFSKILFYDLLQSKWNEVKACLPNYYYWLKCIHDRLNLSHNRRLNSCKKSYVEIF